MKFQFQIDPLQQIFTSIPPENIRKPEVTEGLQK